MIDGVGSSSGSPRDPDRALRQSAQQMEGMFYQYLFKAMRETVPTEGLFGGEHEAMFTEMMDEKVAQMAAEQRASALSEALHRQLSGYVRQSESHTQERP